MKRFIGAICTLIAGSLGFLLLSLDWRITLINVGDYPEGISRQITGWDIIGNTQKVFDGNAIVDGYILFKISAILLTIISVLLISNTLFAILQNAKVFYSDCSFNLLGAIYLSIFAICSILMLASTFIMAEAMTGTFNIGGEILDINTKATINVWLLFATGMITCVLSWIFCKNKSLY